MTSARLARVVAVGLALAGPGAPARAAATEPATTSAADELEQGQRAYERGDYQTAILHFQRAYERDPSPVYLYPWAQAARNAGDCETAVDLYQRFLDSGVRGDAKVAADKNLARCREELAARPPAPDAEPVEADEPSPPAEVEPPTVTEPPRDDRSPPPKARPDAVGVSLLVTGGVGLLTGVTLLAIAENRRAAQAETLDYQRFDDLDAKIDRLHIAGGITLGVGALLTLGGAVRMVIVRRQRAAEVAAKVAVVPSWTPRGGPMLGFVIRPARIRRGVSVR